MPSSDVNSYFSALSQTFQFADGVCGEEGILKAADLLKDKGHFQAFEELASDRFATHIREKVAPTFWAGLCFDADTSSSDQFKAFSSQVKWLEKQWAYLTARLKVLAIMHDHVNNCQSDHFQYLMNEFKIILRSALHCHIPAAKVLPVIEEFYKLSFKAFYNLDTSFTGGNESGEEILPCKGCSAEIGCCSCHIIVEQFNNTNRILIELELFERMVGDVVTQLIHQQVESHVQATCKGSFDISYLGKLEWWLDNVVVKWLNRVYDTALNDEKVQLAFKTFKQKIHHLLYETYTKTRIDQLFNIIIEYPDSSPAILDLRLCLIKTDLRDLLTTRLQEALETRLLHPGVSTPDIITAFSSSIRALKHLDPTGVLLETVTKPIRQYLRWREDTVRCVVVSLTEEGPGELAEELVREPVTSPAPETPPAPTEGAPPVSAEQRTFIDWQTWKPDPVDAPDPKSSKNNWDIISMLVNVYGSKDMFVNEYKSLLADRLLTQFSYNTEKEIRYLELLKLRFGDSQLHYCDVMLKDIYDSRRISAHLFSDANFGLSDQPISCTAMILSGQFWPPFKEETLELPPVIKDLFTTYTKAFETFKGNRTLNWKPHLGSVVLDIELKGRTLNLTVTPPQASVIWYFQEKDEWTVEELCSKLHMTPTLLRRRVAFWQSQGLLKEVSSDRLVLVEEGTGRAPRVIASSDLCDDDDTESVTASAHDQREEELQVFWSYIVGMLTNLDSLPLDRIHQMLKMFASQGPSSVECTLHQLKNFLDRKVREHKLIFSAGCYRLPK